MRHADILCLVVTTTALLFIGAGSGTALPSVERTYWPGVTGHITRVDFPVDATHPKDRIVNVVVTLPENPNASQRALDGAFHAVCQRHQGDLLKATKTLSLNNDWRVKVGFMWPAAAAHGLTLNLGRNKTMMVSNCRFE